MNEDLIEHDEGRNTTWPRGSFRWLFNPKLSKDYFLEEDGFPNREVNELRIAVIQALSPIVDRKAEGSAE